MKRGTLTRIALACSLAWFAAPAAAGQEMAADPSTDSIQPIASGDLLAAATPTQRSQRTGRSSSRTSQRPSARPTSRPAARPQSRPTSRPSARPQSRPSSRPAARPTSRPAQRPTARPAQRPAQRPSTRPAQRPAQRPSARPAQRPAQRPSARPAQRPSSQPAARPVQRPTSRPTTQPVTRPRPQPSSSRPTTSQRPGTSRPIAPSSSQARPSVPTTSQRGSASTGRAQSNGASPQASPVTDPVRSVQPRVRVPKRSTSSPSALSRARQRARETGDKAQTPRVQPTGVRSRRSVPSTAERIQQDRLDRARGTYRTRPSGVTARAPKSPSASIGAGRVEAARERAKARSGQGITPKSRTALRPQADKRGPKAQRPTGTAGPTTRKEGAGKRPSARGGVIDRGQLKEREAKRRARAKDDYLDSIGRGARGDRGAGRGDIPPGNNRGDFRPTSGRPGGITPGAGGGPDITPGSGHRRHLYGDGHHRYHRHGWHGGHAWSRYYWNWGFYGSGYGWAWCPLSWVSYYWWDRYWYFGGSWHYGYRPSYYWYGPLCPPSYQVVVQVVQEEPEVQYVAADSSVPMGEAVADPVEPAPVLPTTVPKMNRAAEYYLTLGDRAFQSGRYGDAVHHYGKAVEYSPNEGILYLILSDALFATADYHYGAFAFRKALDLDPELVELAGNKRSYYGIPSDLDLHMTRARTFVLNQPQNVDARLLLAANELFTGQPERAVTVLEEGRSLGVEYSTAMRLLDERARALLLSERPVPAIEAGPTQPAETPSDPIFIVDPPR